MAVAQTSTIGNALYGGTSGVSLQPAGQNVPGAPDGPAPVAGYSGSPGYKAPVPQNAPVMQSVGTPSTGPTTSQANSATPVTLGVGNPGQIPPPNTNSPVPTSQITSGALNIPPTPPSQDPNGSNLVAGSIASVNMQAAPQQQSDTSALDAATGLGQGTQDANSLYSSTQTPDEQQAQSNIDQGINEYGQESSQLGNQATDTANAYATGGVNTDMQLVNNLTTQLANQNAQYNNAAQTAETNGINSGTPSVIYQGQQAAIQRQQAVQVASTAAQLQAAQGNYTNAKALADQAVTLKYQGIQDKLTATQNFLALNQSNLTNAESQQAAKIAASVQQQQLVLNQQQAVSSLDIQYPNSGINATDSLPQATQKAAAYIAQNGGAETLQVIGQHYDNTGNLISSYGFVNPITKQITPYTANSTQGNMNLGMSTGTNLGMPVYNTFANNSGINAPTRDNNPGDIEATSSSVQLPGVVGIDQSPNGRQYLIFQDPSSGSSAIASTLQGSTYQGLTAQQAINMYITGNKNKSGSYTAADVGLNPSEDFQTQIQDPTTMQNVLQGIATGEGYSNTSQSESEATTPGATSPTIDTTTPGYSTAIVPNSGGQTQAQIDQAALSYALTGQLPTGARATKGPGFLQANAIKARAGQINTGGNIQANAAQVTALSSTLTSATQYATQMQRSIDTVDANVKLLQEAESKVNNSSIPLINQLTNSIKLSTGDGALNAFNAAIQTVRTEYATVLGRGTPTDSTRAEATTLIPNNISADQLDNVIQTLQTEGTNVVTEANQAVQTTQDSLNKIISPGTQNTTTNNSSTQMNGQPYNYNGQTYVQGSDGLYYPSGQQP